MDFVCQEMASCAFTSATVPLGGAVIARDGANACSSTRGRGRAQIEMQGGVGAPLKCGSKCSSSARLVAAVRGGRAEGRVFARQGLGSAAKEDVGLLYPNIAAASLRELETLQSRRWSDGAMDELAAAREAFANGGEITELGMDRLVDSLLKEEGQSAEDYQRRAKFFHLIAEFFRQGKAFSSAETDAPSGHAARTMQSLVDSILAKDGRSAADYNVRAQFFAKSAEIFPFNAEVRRM